jgi:hypothetical protein
MRLYYPIILDHAGTEVLRLKYTATAKHAAFIAEQYVRNCPPAAGFKIKMLMLDASTIADIMNRERGH